METIMNQLAIEEIENEEAVKQMGLVTQDSDQYIPGACTCTKCGESVQCQHDVKESHLLTLCGACSQ